MPARPEEYWQKILNGEDRGLKFFERFFGHLPAPPRCKLCHAPFKGPYAPVLKVLGFRRWNLNRQICRNCVSSLPKHRGGAEIPVSLLYSDVRGSTTLAETMSPGTFSHTLDQFFSIVAAAVDSESGVIDHIVGDGVMAMWIPGFVGANHPHRAVAAGRKVAADLASRTGEPDGFPAGVGVHTGIAYVGVVGEGDSLDFSVIGDTANTVARLGSSAAAGELILSEAIVGAAGVATDGLTHRVLDLKGKSEAFGVWVATTPTRSE